MSRDIVHGDTEKPDHLRISISFDRSTGDARFVSFQLPGHADRGKKFAIGFADSQKDDAGKWTVKMVEGATRVLDVRDCGDVCTVRLLGGIVANDSGTPELDFVKAMLEHNLLLMFYFHDGQRVKAAAELDTFKEEYQAAERQTAP